MCMGCALRRIPAIVFISFGSVLLVIYLLFNVPVFICRVTGELDFFFG